MTKPTTYRDLLNTAAVLATRAGIDQATFREAADDAYSRLIDLGYTPNTGPLPPAPIPLQTDLNPKAAAILQFYAKTEATKGRPPSIRETAEALDIPSPDTVAYHLKKLVNRCLMQHTPGETRNYRTRWS